MPKLNDTQLILLSTASQHPERNFRPLPATLADAGDRTAKAIAALTKRGFAEERETDDTANVARTDGDIRYGLFITEAGIAALDAGKAPTSSSSTELRVTKSAMVLDLLRRADGATLAELIDATAWLPHTTRAALTGLRKKGHAIERMKRDDQTCYRIAA